VTASRVRSSTWGKIYPARILPGRVSLTLTRAMLQRVSARPKRGSFDDIMMKVL
jgi:hypothetical protein